MGNVERALQQSLSKAVDETLAGYCKGIDDESAQKAGEDAALAAFKAELDKQGFTIVAKSPAADPAAPQDAQEAVGWYPKRRIQEGHSAGLKTPLWTVIRAIILPKWENVTCASGEKLDRARGEGERG